MALKRPRRRDYDSEPEWLNACLRYLDAKWPAREDQRKRVQAFARWDAEASIEPARVIERLRELIVRDDLTPDEEAEFERLADLYRDHKKHSTKGI